MNAPVDIKAVLDAIGDAEAARSQPVSVHVYIDDSAPRDLANIAIAATRSVSANADVLVDAYLPQHGIPDASADMALVVAGASEKTGVLYRDMRTVGVPTAVMALDANALCAQAHAAGADIEIDDVIAPRKRADEDAMAGPSREEPIFPDTADAQEMLESLGEWIVGVFKEKRSAFANAFPCVRRPLAIECINATAVQNAGIGVVAIIPGADMPLMTLNQVKMLLEIAGAYGEELTLGRVKEILAVVGGAFAFRGIARQVVGIVPGVGWAVKGGIGYAGTVAMGHALLEYFESGADVAATAQSAASTLKNAPAWMGLSRDKGIAGNAALIAGSAKDAAVRAVENAAQNVVPTVTSVARAAGEATGFTKGDVTAAAGKLIGGVKARIGK